MTRSSASAVAMLLATACATARPPDRVQRSTEPTGPNDVAARRASFEGLLVEHWDHVLSHGPEWASILGDKRWNDRSSDLSAEAVAADLEKTKEFLRRFEAVDVTGFSEQEALTRTLLVRSLREEIEDAPFQDWKMPVTQFFGIHLWVPQLPALLSFASARDYEDYLARLRALPRQLADTEANMRLGMAAGLMPPRFLLEKVVVQAQAVASQKPENSPFASPLARMPDDVAPAERARIREAVLAAIQDLVLPAYGRFAAFVRDEYAPHGRSEAGIWSLPDGASRYSIRVKRATTSSLGPDRIHDLGLREVARIEKEMKATARGAGFADLASFHASVKANPELRPRSREQILEIYRGHLDGMRPELETLFGKLPRADFVVVAMEPFREEGAAAAEYVPPAPDGSRPGRVEVNTGSFADRTTLDMEATAYHEGVPGHHLQAAIQQELAEVPPVRRLGLAYTAFDEGWALYAERLAEEVGHYRDPYSRYGRLQSEMLRAIRLVVDTGLHEKRWTREQVVRFFHDHSTIDDVDVQAETDRYIANPGQALAYKVGELRIRELRERAETRLGPAFDVRGFHDVVLGAGSLPLEVLDARVDAWISETAAKPPRK